MRSSTHLTSSLSCFRRQLRPSGQQQLIRPAAEQASASVASSSSFPSQRNVHVPGNTARPRWSSTSTSTTSNDLANTGTGTAQQPRWRQRSPVRERRSSRNSKSNSKSGRSFSFRAAMQCECQPGGQYSRLLHRPTLPVGSFRQQSGTICVRSSKIVQSTQCSANTETAAVALNG
jgi:hypothetical protein